MHLHFLDLRCRIGCTNLGEVGLRFHHGTTDTLLDELRPLLLGIEKSGNFTRSSECV